jgi:CheY-like chemotaxis protein
MKKRVAKKRVIKGRVLHLEDLKDWIRHVRELIGDEYDLYSVTSVKDAARLLHEMAVEGLKFDLAIVDISMDDLNAHDKGGFKFAEALEQSGVLPGKSIIILSGYLDVDENWRVAFRDYDVVDVFDKATLVDQLDQFKKTIADTVERTKSLRGY